MPMAFERTMQMDTRIILPVFGQFDANIKKIEKACEVSIVNRGDDVKISGEEKNVHKAWNVMHSLAALARKGEEITEQNLEYFISSAEEADLSRVRAAELIDRRLGALSGGELQRVLVALALNPMPDLLLLDEPVSGVDQNGLEIFYEILEDLQNNEDMAIILVSHDLNMVARHADQVVLMDKGVVCSGTSREVFQDARTRKIFGMLAEGR